MNHDFGVDATLASCVAKWGLTVERPLEGGHSSKVFLCVMPDASRAVLKIPATQEEAAWEVVASAVWASGSNRTVVVRDSDVATGAILLQLIEPATPLPPGDTATAIAVVADLCRLLHVAPTVEFPNFAERFGAYEQRALRDARYEQEVLGNAEPPGLRLLPKARATAFKLSATAISRVLLHGDLCDKNILLDNGQYIVIDPMPMIGDACSDVGFFAAYHPLASDAFQCASGLAVELGYDQNRCERWTAVWLTHQACESWRADSEELYALVGSPTFELVLNS